MKLALAFAILVLLVFCCVFAASSEWAEQRKLTDFFDKLFGALVAIIFVLSIGTVVYQLSILGF